MSVMMRFTEQRERIEGQLEQITQYVYDRQGNLLQTIYPSGTKVTSAFDKLNRVETIKAPVLR